MDPETSVSSSVRSDEVPDVGEPHSVVHEKEIPQASSSLLSTSAISSWTKSLKLPQIQQEAQPANAGKFTFSRLASGLGLQMPSKAPVSTERDDNSAPAQSGVIASFGKGIVDSSLNAVKAVQVKAKHIVSQNKRRYQEGGFDLDMTYITENIIAMGFPAGDMSSGLIGYFEGFYRNHMEEVIKFFETHHKGGHCRVFWKRLPLISADKIHFANVIPASPSEEEPFVVELNKYLGKYKVYNLCSERLYDASLFGGKVATFPFDDHNCPPIHLIDLFCKSAYSWLKEDITNVVVVHCKAGKARTGLMICSLLLFLKFFPTVEECISYYNQKRCVDAKGLILPSQIRYVKYFERILTQFSGETPPGRRCMLRGFRLHNCQYWVRPSITISNHSGVLFSTKKHPRTKDLMPQDFWLRAPKKGFVVFALPGEPGLTELVGDFKVHFHDRQGDFYCWLNTTMMENRVILEASELDDFDKRKLPSPGFQLEIVMIDYDGTIPSKVKTNNDPKGSDGKSKDGPSSSSENTANAEQDNVPRNQNNEDDEFSDSGGEEHVPSRSSVNLTISTTGTPPQPESTFDRVSTISNQTEQLSLGRKSTSSQPDTSHEQKNDVVEKSSPIPNMDSTDIKAIAADASVFSFGDDEDYDTE